MRRKVISRLKIHPKLRRDLEKSREQPGCLGRNTSFAFNNLINALNRNTEYLCQLELAESQRGQKFVQQNFPWVCCNSVPWHHKTLSLVVVGDSYVDRNPIAPPKYHSKLIVYADTVKTCQIARQLL